MKTLEQSYRFSDDLQSMGFFGFDVKRTPEQEEKLFGWQKELKTEPKTERSNHFILRDCGTGAGGFKAGNACAKGGDGDGDLGADDGSEWDGMSEEFASAGMLTFASHQNRKDVLDSMTSLPPDLKANLTRAHRKLHDAEVQYVKTAADETKTAKDMNDQWLQLQKANLELSEAYIKNLPLGAVKQEFTAKMIDATVKSINERTHVSGMHISDETANWLKGTHINDYGRVALNCNPIFLNQMQQAITQRDLFFPQPQRNFEFLMSKKLTGASNRSNWSARYVARSVGTDRMEVGNARDFHDSILHELAHGQHRTEQPAAYFARNGTGTFGKMWLTAANREMRKMAKDPQVKIRAYGKTNVYEYVTCTMERLRQGTQLTPYEWDIFDKCAPPEIRPSIRKKLTSSVPRPEPKRKPARKKPTKKKEEP